MAEYVCREGTVTAADTKTALTTQGSETAPGAITVPSGTSRIAQIIAAAVADCSATGNVSFLARIAGNAVQGGEQTITLGAIGGTLATGGAQGISPMVLDVDIPVTAGKQVSLAAEMCGTDVGESEVSITVVFA